MVDNFHVLRRASLEQAIATMFLLLVVANIYYITTRIHVRMIIVFADNTEEEARECWVSMLDLETVPVARMKRGDADRREGAGNTEFVYRYDETIATAA